MGLQIPRPVHGLAGLRWSKRVAQLKPVGSSGRTVMSIYRRRCARITGVFWNLSWPMSGILPGMLALSLVSIPANKPNMNPSKLHITACRQEAIRDLSGLVT